MKEVKFWIKVNGKHMFELKVYAERVVELAETRNIADRHALMHWRLLLLHDVQGYEGRGKRCVYDPERLRPLDGGGNVLALVEVANVESPEGNKAEINAPVAFWPLPFDGAMVESAEGLLFVGGEVRGKEGCENENK